MWKDECKQSHLKPEKDNLNNCLRIEPLYTNQTKQKIRT